MAHFAKISETNEVLTVLTLNNSDMLNSENVETETVGQAYLEKHNNWPLHLWIQTSYNTVNNTHTNGGIAFRGNHAGRGYTWDEDNNIFWPKKPYASWVKHLATASWKSPIGDAPALTEEQTLQNKTGTHFWNYSWNETNTTWNLIVRSYASPALTAEQQAQNDSAVTDIEGNITTPATHSWSYVWNETNKTWDLTDSKA